MAVANIAALLTQSACLSCLSPKQRKMIAVVLLANAVPLPARLSNTVAWYAAYRPGTVTKNASNQVSRLADVSGKGHDLTITTASDGYILTAGDVNSGGLAYLSNRNQVNADPFQTVNFGLVQPVTIYLLSRVTATNGITGNLVDGLTTNSTPIVLSPTSTTVRLDANVAFNTAIPGGLNTWFVATAIFQGATSFFQVNRLAGITGDPSSVDPGGITIGSRSDGNRIVHLDVMEAIVRTGADDAATRDAIQLYLAQKVALVI